MNTAIVTAVLGLIQQLLPKLFGDTALIQTIIATLQQLVPLIIKEVQDLTPVVKNIIDALTAEEVTPQQLADLKAMSDQIDAAFEDAAKQAQAEDEDDGA